MYLLPCVLYRHVPMPVNQVQNKSRDRTPTALHSALTGSRHTTPILHQSADRHTGAGLWKETQVHVPRSHQEKTAHQGHHHHHIHPPHPPHTLLAATLTSLSPSLLSQWLSTHACRHRHAPNTCLEREWRALLPPPGNSMWSQLHPPPWWSFLLSFPSLSFFFLRAQFLNFMFHAGCESFYLHVHVSFFCGVLHSSALLFPR